MRGYRADVRLIFASSLCDKLFRNEDSYEAFYIKSKNSNHL